MSAPTWTSIERSGHPGWPHVCHRHGPHRWHRCSCWCKSVRPTIRRFGLRLGVPW